MSNLEGVFSVDLVPSDFGTALELLSVACADSPSRLRAAVAYWTVNGAFVGGGLPALLNEGFLCVDIHLPTSVDALAGLKRDGANVKLFLEEIGTKKDFKFQKHLLHTKMLAFDKADGTAELWIGSHNWTQRALYDLNIESSVRFLTSQSAPLYLRATEYLEEISSRCTDFDLELVDEYKRLQEGTKEGNEQETPTITISTKHLEDLSATSITIFGDDERDLETFGKLIKLYVQLTMAGGSKQNYTAEIIQFGRISGFDEVAKGLTFSDRRYALFRSVAFTPELTDEKAVPNVAGLGMTYFVTVYLHSASDIEFVEPMTASAAWVEVPLQESAIIRRYREHQFSQNMESVAPIPRKVRIPRFLALDRGLDVPEQRARLQERRLVTLRIARRRSDVGGNAEGEGTS